uniref:Uncharacterized protein n=1 Tax=Oryza brachyantha TaxID=4533 RepID=J3M0A0_ORYBR
MVNKKMNPTANNMGVLYCIEPPHMVAIQLRPCSAGPFPNPGLELLQAWFE